MTINLALTISNNFMKITGFCITTTSILLCILSSTFATDGYALLAFKDHLNLDPNNILATNWSKNTNFCNWVGVSCDYPSMNQRVSSLDLSSMGLKGTIPPHVGNLSFLSALNLENNNFHGPLPPQLVNLTHLTYINLGANNFGGEIIPSWFASFPRLEHLYLFRTLFSGPIPRSLCTIPSLKTLSLSNNSLAGNLPVCIGNLSNLETLDFSGNRYILGSIPTSIFNLSSLKMLNLAANVLSGTLPDHMCQHLPNLVTLNFTDNKLSGKIPSSLSNCKKLVFISLGFNKFNGTFPSNLGNLTLLQGLYLRRNDLRDGVTYDIDSPPSLKDFNVRDNYLRGSFPRNLLNCSLLLYLVLGHNGFTGQLPNEIGKLNDLEFLNVGYTRLSGPLPSAALSNTSLKVLPTYGSRYSGTLPSGFFLGLPNLEKLYLWRNEFTGPIPSSISNASMITLASFDNNFFSGTLPNTLSSLRHLSWLSISYTNVTDESTQELTFLSSLTNCTALTLLGLEGNTLDVSIPRSIGNLSTTLEYLSIQSSKVKGRIPEEISNLRGLMTLYLGDNALIGSIPETIGSLQKLQVLSLGGNQLSGTIPSDVCSLRNLGELYLSRNELVGSLPACVGSMTSLRILHLDSNNFSSALPSAFWSVKDILDVNLSSNSLIGNLPPDIGNLKVVAAVDLSNNLLSGVIPSNMGGLQSLTNLSLARNKFQGLIPESFGTLISLEVLDLSNNYLSGQIPKSLEELRYLKYLNVSFNELDGEIPARGPFVNFSAQSFLGNDALCSGNLQQFSPCKNGKSKNLTQHLLKYILPPTVLSVLVMYCVLALLRRKRSAKQQIVLDTVVLPSWEIISYHDLQEATEDFSESNVLGAGGFGTVYKGKLSDETDAAIKVFNLQIEGAFKSFDAECEVMRNIRHRNLVKVISSCSNGLDFKALILEYMPNGSLEKWLYSYNYCLDILQRVNIMIDVATALDYLHHGFGKPIVHCDLKPSNVLLDADMVAHVGDFGIAKLLGAEDSMTQTMTLATIGYMAPEYGLEGIVSIKGDVFSFGILLMETFSRKKPTDEMFAGGMRLNQYVKDALPHAVAEIADANLLTGEQHFSAKEECISCILGLAVDCTAELSGERIDITEALAALKHIKNKFIVNTVPHPMCQRWRNALSN